MAGLEINFSTILFPKQHSRTRSRRKETTQTRKKNETNAKITNKLINKNSIVYYFMVFVLVFIYIVKKEINFLIIKCVCIFKLKLHFNYQNTNRNVKKN